MPASTDGSFISVLRLKDHFSISYLLIGVLLIILLVACSESAPTTELMQRQIANLLIRDTMGKLFEVHSVHIEKSTQNDENEYIVLAKYSLKYTNTMNGYLAYLFEKTNIDSRIDGTGVKKDVREKLAKKYGDPVIGKIHDFQGQFVFRKEALGWQIQSGREHGTIDPL